MLSIFPELLSLNILGVSIIRITLGLVILYLGLMTTGIKKNTYSAEMHLRNYPLAKIMPIIFGLIQIVTGVFLIFGFITQIMTLVSIYIFINLIFIEKYVGRVFKFPVIFYLTMIMISIALLFLGPGAFAVDLPL